MEESVLEEDYSMLPLELVQSKYFLKKLITRIPKHLQAELVRGIF
jgi:hypothetical protein